MERRRVLWAIAFGGMLAITGCGDEDGGDSEGTGATSGTGGMTGTGGSGTGGMTGTGGSGGSMASGVEGFCQTLCQSCAGNVVSDCRSECEMSFSGAGTGIDFDSCPTELDALGNCLGANNCNSDTCSAQIQAYVVCIVGLPL